MNDSYDLAIVGAGLSALSFLRAGGATGKTAVIDYRDRPGGWLQPALPAPGLEEAADLIASFQWPSNINLSLNTTAVGLLPAFSGPHTILVRTRDGTHHLRASRILIASGGLEITREHDQIPGSRPAGITTPSFIFQTLDRGYLPGRRALIYGESHYAAAVGAALIRSGVALVESGRAQHAPTSVASRADRDGATVPTEASMPFPTTPPRPRTGEGVGGEGARGRARQEAPPTTPSAPRGEGIIEIRGFPRLETVLVRKGGNTTDIAADLLVYARGMIANTLWLKGSGIDLEPDGPIRIGDRFMTNLPGIYAIGTVVAPDLDHSRSIEMGEAAARLLKEEL